MNIIDVVNILQVTHIHEYGIIKIKKFFAFICYIYSWYEIENSSKDNSYFKTDYFLAHS